jgi:hypothetical protein
MHMASTPPTTPTPIQIHSVLGSLMDRLAKYASADKAVMQRLLDMRAFERFRDAIARIISAQVRVSLDGEPDTRACPCATARFSARCTLDGGRVILLGAEAMTEM